MRWVAVLWGLGCVSLLGCARLNPAYGDDAATDGVSATSGSSSPDGGGSTGATAAGSGSASAETLGTGPALACGDGVLDDGEECDDGNTEAGDACTPECTHAVTEAWRHEGALIADVRARFNDVAFAGQGIVAVGRAVDDGGTTERVALTHLTPEGQLTSTALVEGVGDADGLGALGDGSRVYVAGLELAGPQVAVAARVDFSNVDAPTVEWSRAIDGTRAGSLVLYSGMLVVGTGLFDNGGLGFSFLEPGTGDTASMGGVNSRSTPSQIYALVERGGDVFGAGMLQGAGFVSAFPELPGLMLPMPLVVFEGESMGSDRFQALAFKPDGWLVVAGSVFGAAGEGENAWIGALDPASGRFAWTVSIDAGSLTDDEIEDVAVDQDGNVVAVGMLGAPPQPTVWKFDGGRGTLLWSTEILAPGLYGMARGVVVDDAAVFVVGEHRESETTTRSWAVRLSDHG